ncbi:MAG: hypothetical protein JXA78_12200 [Anaerolineales bacterium]|nr:hypothetical protein [Anaerolineales bacterium]
MTVRPFDWRDLPALHRCRNQSIYLDSARALARGTQLLPGALLSYLAPATGVFTCVFDEGDSEESPIMGQFVHALGSQLARLTFLTPETALESAGVAALLEYMAAWSGERGALRLMADVDERTHAFDALRRSGFAIYSRQRVWQLASHSSGAALSSDWRPATSQDEFAIRSLYNNLVPGLVQQVEPYALQNLKGMLYHQDGELLAFVEFKYGRRGVWIQPFVHPDAQDVADHLSALMQNIPNRYSRPLYICVRSYQSWLETLLEDSGAQAGPRQAVMVKYLAAPQRAVRAFALPALEGGQPEITAPIVRSESK